MIVEALIAAVVLASLALIMALVVRHSTAKLATHIEQLEARVKASEQMQSVLARSYRGLTQTLANPVAAQSGDEAKYSRAAQLITRGASAEELARTLALPLEEAELMIQINGGQSQRG